MQFSIKKFFPYIAAIVLFAVLTLIYFKPLLSGKEISQHDIMQARGMSKEIADFREKYKSEPLWTNSMFGGMPAYQVSTIYPGNWLGTIDKAFKLFLPHPSGYIFLCFVGFFIFEFYSQSVHVAWFVNLFFSGVGGRTQFKNKCTGLSATFTGRSSVIIQRSLLAWFFVNGIIYGYGIKR